MRPLPAGALAVSGRDRARRWWPRVVPHRWARALLVLVVLAMLVDAALAVVHVGVEQHYWPSPLPECAAPRFTGGSIAERLAQMPARPAKPCEDAAYLIPGLPISMAAMNLLYALAFALVLGVLLWRDRGALHDATVHRRLPGDPSHRG